LAIKGEFIDCINNLINFGANINTKGKSSNSSLQIAVKTGNKEIIKLLLDNSCQISVINSQGGTALSMSLNDEYTLKYLLQELPGKDIEKMIKVLDSKGFSIFHICCMDNKIISLALLINKLDTKQIKTLLNEQCKYSKRTPLHWATYSKVFF
jgi:ankyrin repeat protein